MSAANHPTNPFIRRLNAIADLPKEVSDALRDAIGDAQQFTANQDIVSRGDNPSRCSVLLEGWIARRKNVEGGRRQITALHFDGIMLDLQGLFTSVFDHTITTLTSARIGFITHTALRDLMGRFPALSLALWRETLIEAAISREWEVNLAARSAVQRIAHLFCETATRQEWFGQMTREGGSLIFPWPLTQIQLSEATGLSVVHVNRSLQELRGTNLVHERRQFVTIPDMAKLCRFAGFDPDYLAAEQPRKYRERIAT